MLKSGGRAAILVPTGILAVTSAAERALRERLLKANILEAVISLPKDAFQPYSIQQTHLIIFRKPLPNESTTTEVLFYRVEHDGFSGGRRRVPDPDNNDLPALEATFALLRDKPGTPIQDTNGLVILLEEIEKKGFDLQPKSYLPTSTSVEEGHDPAVLLASIKGKQQQLHNHIDYLLGIIELRPLTTEKLPPPVRPMEPFGNLSDAQKATWESIQGLVQCVPSDDAQSYETARHFRADDLERADTLAGIMRSLDLFERMGLIVKVNVEGGAFYRRVTDRDWLESTSSEEQ